MAPLQNQVKGLGIQDKIGRQIFREDNKNVFEPVTNLVKYVSKGVTKTMTETADEYNEGLTNFRKKHLNIMKDRVTLASYSLSPLSQITNSEHASQFKLREDLNSNRVEDLLIKN